MVNGALLMDLADCGSPERLLGVILDHHREWQPPVDVETFARSVGILEFRDLQVDGFVGALMTDLEKTKGVILSAAGMPPPRRRFTVAHELGHFIIAAHRGDKQCTSKDLMEMRRETLHQKEEAQANRFASGLLMPKPWFVAQTNGLGSPKIEHLRLLADTYGVSLEAAGNRYPNLPPRRARSSSCGMAGYATQDLHAPSRRSASGPMTPRLRTAPAPHRVRRGPSWPRQQIGSGLTRGRGSHPSVCRSWIRSMASRLRFCTLMPRSRMTTTRKMT